VLRLKASATSAQADHLIACTEVWTCVAVRLSGGRGPRLARFTTEAEIRRSLPTRARALIPDALLTLAFASDAVFIAIELDLGTELPRVIGDKARRYAPFLSGEALFYGLPLTAVVFYAPGIGRLARLALEVAGTAADSAAYFQDLNNLTADTVLERLATIRTLAATGTDPQLDPFSVSLLGGAP
jgi:hypothetical protein